MSPALWVGAHIGQAGDSRPTGLPLSHREALSGKSCMPLSWLQTSGASIEIGRKYYFTAHHNINVMVANIAGTSNIIADALSRFQMHRFRILAPQANLLPDTILALPIHTSPN